MQQTRFIAKRRRLTKNSLGFNWLRLARAPPGVIEVRLYAGVANRFFLLALLNFSSQFLGFNLRRPTGRRAF